ncbi:Type I secretion outer membrane protein, TolC precursor [Rubellimicrobium mesophilum DSM 19309]|uniref:Type I secretion outer membrane protein, TolC n=1 Tax=Rubellimicrobium mesophilum DSM 19309 TaxID=442562 RepID=A0A017HPY8_9RHOB|nr:TolC family outer membrane protein [Rubellimicrobium mesophilum]EYD76527.1 Type I secretion outer membrane protein, TolC precursor [Rubellimicrobium mesophilum DSM 19309]
MRQLIRGTLTAFLLCTTAARAESLADALAQGYESSGLIEQNRALLRAADEDVAQAVAALRPILSYAANLQATYSVSDVQSLLGPSTERTVTDVTATLALNASYTIYDGGSRRLALEAQKELVLATRQALLDVERQVLGRIILAYLDVQRSQAFVDLRQNNVRVITEELRAAQDRFDVGETTRTDVALAEAELASARSQLVAVQGDLLSAREEFRAAVGSLPENLQPVRPARIPASVDEARAIALRTQPSLLQAQHQVAAAEITVRRAESTMRPTVALQGQLSVNRDIERNATIGLQATGPIYQGGALASTVRQAQAQRDAQRASLLETARNVEQDVADAYATLQTASASRQAFEEQVRAAQVAFGGVREEAQLGARTTLDVLNAEQDLLDARANLVSAGVDEVTASYQVLAALGLLNVQNLGLNVQVYDPTAYYNLVDDAPTATSEQGRALDRVLDAIGRE